jgi:aryl-alcohol dehydrogenase-like predicted oxidoreductase
MEVTAMRKKQLGQNGPPVSALGLGCGGMSPQRRPGADAESIATIQAALDAGITLLNTADFYGMGHNESLIGRAIAGRRDHAFLSVKFGMLRSPSGAFLGIDGRPNAVKISRHTHSSDWVLITSTCTSQVGPIHRRPTKRRSARSRI